MPPLEEQTALHNAVFETLQIALHYVIRHYVRALEDLAIRGLLEKKQARCEVQTLLDDVVGGSSLSSRALYLAPYLPPLTCLPPKKK
eukprot:scaffold195859_cov20-Prasinocladus_malaysianus.AAC.1